MPDPRTMAAIHAAAFDRERPWTETEFTSFKDSPLCFSVGDERAFALARVIADEAELLTLATHPDHQRQGLARECMMAWETIAQNRGAVRAFLEVAADNDAARALYSLLDYTECGRRSGYYKRIDGNTCDAVIMEKDLTLG